MRAAFYQGARTFTTGTLATPTPGPGQALLRVKRVGICGTDLHIFQGHLDHRVPKGGIIGHETFGEVAQAPAGSGFKTGDRVVVEPLQFCGQCRACRMGASYLCYGLKVLGVDLPGGMQEYWTVDAARLLRVPDALSDDHAALIEPLAVATHDVRRAAVKRDDTVLVFGGGPIGALIALVSRQRGARGLGGGDPPRRRGRRAGGAPREPEDPPRGAPAGHGAGARRRTGHEGSRGPHDIDALAWAAGALIILGASLVMGLAGFGIGLVSLAFLPYLMAPAEAIVLMTLYAATFALAIFVPVRDSFAPARVVDLVIGTVVGTPLGVWALARLPATALDRLIGLMLVIAGALEWRGLAATKLEGRRWGLGAGVLAGVIGGAVGTPGPPVVLYATTQGWSPRTIKANLQALDRKSVV